MVAGYLIVMAALAAGLRLQLRSPAAAREPTAGEPPAGEPPAEPAAEPGRPRWGRLARHVAATVVGGYLLLMLVVIGYYYGVARVGGAFIGGAFTGCAMLIGLAVPAFAALSWLTNRRRRSS